jgi:hypothetical protein
MNPSDPNNPGGGENPNPTTPAQAVPNPTNPEGPQDVRVSTWLAVMAQVARSRAQFPVLGENPEEANDEYETRVMQATHMLNPRLGAAAPREALVTIAALSLRMLDEIYPGDGLQF